MTEQAETLTGATYEYVELVMPLQNGMRSIYVGNTYEADVALDDQGCAVTFFPFSISQILFWKVKWSKEFNVRIPLEMRDQLPTPFPKEGVKIMLAGISEVEGQQMITLRVLLPA